ncbi:MAG: DUF3536 domain-containing protein [Myxococcota bacterium]
MSHPPALVIHGHFYQPPRDNPWTGQIERQPSAAPFHDWNARIDRECYRPNGWARIFDDRGRVRRIVNNYERLSFNFGPTLLSWLERHQPRGYRRILEADRRSRAGGGHGNAIAQGYHHAILPLCNDRDLRTQVRWGCAEFAHRYGRTADALWLPETACDDRTLGVLIDEGLRYALLAPNQADAVDEGAGWRDVSDGSIDPGRPYRFDHPDGSGRSLALFFYDGAISQAIAFEGVLSSSRALVDRFSAASGGNGTIVHAVTDGESYGHHHRFGDRCLAHALFEEAERQGFWVTNYATLLDHHPAPLPQVRIKGGDEGRGTSWSCAHGVGRWMRDCGCHTGGGPGCHQRWRAPLRAALDTLRDAAATAFAARLEPWFEDPWALRDDYIALLLHPTRDRAAFLAARARVPLDAERVATTLGWLEAQREAMAMYTSCGWFFHDLAGIETLQVMRYAGRLVDRLAGLGVSGVEASLLAQLAEAETNDPACGNGADLYRREVWPQRVTAEGLAAHVAMSQVIDPQSGPQDEVAGHRVQLSAQTVAGQGGWTVATARVALEARATGTRTDHATCVLHLGGVDLHCAVCPFPGETAFAKASARLQAAGSRGSWLALVRAAEAEFGAQAYGLTDVLESGRERVSQTLFEALRRRYAAFDASRYEEAAGVLRRFVASGLPVPPELRAWVGAGLRRRWVVALGVAERGLGDGFDPRAYDQALALAAPEAAVRLERALTTILGHLETGAPAAALGTNPITAALELLDTARRLGLTLDLEVAQEQVYAWVMPTLATGADDPPSAPSSRPELEALLAAFELSGLRGRRSASDAGGETREE